MLVALLGVSIFMPQWTSTEEVRRGGDPLPAELDGWIKDEKLSFDWAFFWTVSYSKLEYRRYERDYEKLSVFIGYDDRKYRGRSLLSPKNAVPGRGWEIEERGRVELGSGGPRVERVVARSISGRTLSYHWYEGTDRLARETVRQLLATDQSRFRRTEPARVIRITTELGTDSLDQALVESELHAFATSLAVALRE
jgi:EpsI family protein